MAHHYDAPPSRLFPLFPKKSGARTRQEFESVLFWNSPFGQRTLEKTGPDACKARVGASRTNDKFSLAS
jgi:hypothetical protein